MLLEVTVDPLHRRIAALESEVRRLSANQGSSNLEDAIRRVRQHRLDSARYMQMRAIPTSGLGGNSELDETLRAADQDLARYGYY